MAAYFEDLHTSKLERTKDGTWICREIFALKPGTMVGKMYALSHEFAAKIAFLILPVFLLYSPEKRQSILGHPV